MSKNGLRWSEIGHKAASVLADLGRSRLHRNLLLYTLPTFFKDPFAASNAPRPKKRKKKKITVTNSLKSSDFFRRLGVSTSGILAPACFPAGKEFARHSIEIPF